MNRRNLSSQARNPLRILTVACVAGVVCLARASAAAEVQEAAAGQIDWVAMGLTFAAGLALFLWGIHALAQRLGNVASERLKSVLHKGSANPVAGLLSGTAATFVLDSSSATIILLIAMVDANLIGFAASLPVILGSNIGTTLSSQVFALNADAYAPVLLVTGLLVVLLSSSDGWKRWGDVIFCIGLVLFALTTMGDAMAPLKDQAGVKEWLTRFNNPFLGILAGAAATVALQSSSAMMGIVITMASQNLISLEAGLALMLGAEIGTCADTMLATIGRSAAAVRAGVFHLGFNLVTAGIGAALVGALASAARASAATVPQQIANAHVAFNVVGALVFLFFTKALAAWLARIIPGRVPGLGASGA